MVSWNIRAGGGVRAEKIASQIRRWRPDIVALMEFRDTPPSRWLAETLSEQGLMHQRTTADAANPAVNSLLLASRWPLRRVGVTLAPDNARRWLLAKVYAPEPFSMGVMHIPNRNTGMKFPYLDSALNVARRWSGGPALLIGDTNSGQIDLDEEVPCFGPPEDGWLTALHEANWRDAYRLLHGEARAYTWYSPNKGNGFRLDQAFLNRGMTSRLHKTRYEWGVDESRIDTRTALSDHSALILDFLSR
jgi:exonuclease III